MHPFLHVGCGPKRNGRTTKVLSSADWTELQFDISKEALNEGQMKALAVTHMTPL